MKYVNALLLVIDPQNDFCLGGSMAVPSGDDVIPIINSVARKFQHMVITQDWHPEGHLSFASSHTGKKPFDVARVEYGSQVLWQEHCIQGTRGAELHPALYTSRAELILRKGFDRKIDSYSAFFDNDQKTPTGLCGYLRERAQSALYVGGLATDFCVLYSVLDACRLGFEVTVIEDACKGIDVNGSVADAWRQMTKAGATLVTSEQFFQEHG